MSPIEILAILAMTGWAIYKQTQISEIRQHGRFKMAWTYGIVALCVGGFVRPSGTTAWMLLLISIALSFVIGIARGRLTRVWVESTGQIMRQGTTATIGLFVTLILAKFALGTFAYTDHVQDGAGFGEVMAMIAVMIAVQAEIVWRRGQAITQAGDRTMAAPSPLQVDHP